jgi:hypothetical protein
MAIDSVDGSPRTEDYVPEAPMAEDSAPADLPAEPLVENGDASAAVGDVPAEQVASADRNPVQVDAPAGDPNGTLVASASSDTVGNDATAMNNVVGDTFTLSANPTQNQPGDSSTAIANADADVSTDANALSLVASGSTSNDAPLAGTEAIKDLPADLANSLQSIPVGKPGLDIDPTKFTQPVEGITDGSNDPLDPTLAPAQPNGSSAGASGALNLVTTGTNSVDASQLSGTTPDASDNNTSVTTLQQIIDGTSSQNTVISNAPVDPNAPLALASDAAGTTGGFSNAQVAGANNSVAVDSGNGETITVGIDPKLSGALKSDASSNGGQVGQTGTNTAAQVAGGKDVSTVLGQVAAGLKKTTAPVALKNAATQTAAIAQVGESLINGTSAANGVKAVGAAFGESDIVTPAVDAVQVLTGEKSLTNASDALGIVKDLGNSFGGTDGKNLAQTADVGIAVGKVAGTDLTSSKGIQAELGMVGAVATLFDDPKLAAGASVASQTVNVLSGGASLGNVANLGASALNLLGVDSGVTNTVSTIASAITNPIGTAVGFFVNGLNDALTWKPNESTLSDAYGAVKGTNGTVNVIRAGESDAQNGSFGLKISQLNTNSISAEAMGPSVLKEGEYITNADGNTRATLSDNGQLQLQKKNGDTWQTTYQAGIAVNGKSDTALYVDQTDGKSKIAVAGKAADGSTTYTPIWQSDGSARVDGQNLALNVGNNGVLQVGTKDQQNRDEYNRQYNPGLFGIGGSYNRAENGGAIAQAGTTEFTTKGGYGNFNNASQAPKIQTVDASLGLYDVQFKDQSGVDRELVRQQRNATDLATNSSLSFLEVQDTKYVAQAENFNSSPVINATDAASEIFAGKLVDITRKIDYQSELNDRGFSLDEVAKGDPTHPMNRGIVSALDNKEYRLYADTSNPNATVRVETAAPLNAFAYKDINVDALGVVPGTYRVMGGRGSTGEMQVYGAQSIIDKQVASGALRDISEVVGKGMRVYADANDPSKVYKFDPNETMRFKPFAYDIGG